MRLAILSLCLAMAAAPFGEARARDQERDFLVGARAYLFAPLSADEEIVVNGAGTGTRLNPSVSATIEMNATYLATDYLALEATAAITRHRFHAEDGTLGGIDTVADGWFVPVTLTAQYRIDTGGPLTPYVGAGGFVMFPVDYENTQPFRAAIGSGGQEASVDTSFGWVAQAGVNYAVNDRLYLNVDGKIFGISTEMTLNDNPRATYDLRMTPIVIGLGVGYRF